MTPHDEQLLAAAVAAGAKVPDAERERLANRALAAVETSLVDRLHPGGVRSSVLGAAWSRDLDVHVRTEPDDTELEALGWVPLSRLLRRIGRNERGRWAIVLDGVVAGAVDLHPDPPPEPVAAVLDRARRRRSVGIREALELRVLRRAGEVLPHADPVVIAAADIEHGLGGSELADLRSGVPRTAPVGLAATSRAASLRARLGALRYWLKPRVVVAVSGVDGAGKSTLVAQLVTALEAAGLPAGRVWARPGLGLRWLSSLASVGKRALRQAPEPGVRRMAADTTTVVRSRQGVVGWGWSLLITVAFLRDVWRQHLQAQGVVVYDRHILDAVATLDVLYRGSDLRLQRRLIAAAMPRATLTVYLDLPADVAVARKPGDTIGQQAVVAQLARYRELLGGRRDVLVLDATRPAAELALEVLRRLAGT